MTITSWNQNIESQSNLYFELYGQEKLLKRQLYQIKQQKKRVKKFLKGQVDLNYLKSQAKNNLTHELQELNFEGEFINTSTCNTSSAKFLEESISNTQSYLKSLDTKASTEMNENEVVSLIEIHLKDLTQASSEYLAGKINQPLDLVESILNNFKNIKWYLNPRNNTWYVIQTAYPRKDLNQTQFEQIKIEDIVPGFDSMEIIEDSKPLTKALSKADPLYFKTVLPASKKVAEASSFQDLITKELKLAGKKGLHVNNLVKKIYPKQSHSWNKDKFNYIKSKFLSKLSVGCRQKNVSWITKNKGSGVYFYKTLSKIR